MATPDLGHEEMKEGRNREKKKIISIWTETFFYSAKETQGNNEWTTAVSHFFIKSDLSHSGGLEVIKYIYGSEIV